MGLGELTQELRVPPRSSSPALGHEGGNTKLLSQGRQLTELPEACRVAASTWRPSRLCRYPAPALKDNRVEFPLVTVSHHQDLVTPASVG